MRYENETGLPDEGRQGKSPRERHAHVRKPLPQPRYLVVVCWACVVLALAVPAVNASGSLLPLVGERSGNSRRARELISDKFDTRGAYQMIAVLKGEGHSVDEEDFRRATERLFGAALDAAGLLSVDSYLTSGDDSLVSRDRTTTYAFVNLRAAEEADALRAAEELMSLMYAVPRPGWLEFYITGEEPAKLEAIDESRGAARRSVVLALPVILAVSALAFGRLRGTLLPLLVGAPALVITQGMLFLAARVFDLSALVENYVLLAVLFTSVSYSIFIYRNAVRTAARGMQWRMAVRRSVRTARRPLLLSLVATAPGLAVLAFLDPAVLRAAAVAGFAAAALSALAALTLLPPVLASFRPPQRKAGARCGGRSVAPWLPAPPTMGIVAALISGLGLLALLSFFAFRVHPLQGSIDLVDADLRSRKGYETLVAQFGPGVISPLEIVVTDERSILNSDALDGLYVLGRQLMEDARFERVISIASIEPSWTPDDYRSIYRDNFSSIPAEFQRLLARVINKDSGSDTALLLGFFRSGPSSKEAQQALRDVRTLHLPAVPSLLGKTAIGGMTAEMADAQDDAIQKMFWMIPSLAVAIGMGFRWYSRSTRLALTASLLSALALTALVGFVTLAFEEGLASGLLGFEKTGFATSSSLLMSLAAAYLMLAIVLTLFWDDFRGSVAVSVICSTVLFSLAFAPVLPLKEVVVPLGWLTLTTSLVIIPLLSSCSGYVSR